MSQGLVFTFNSNKWISIIKYYNKIDLVFLRD